MKAFLLAFVLAALASALLTPIVRRYAMRVGAVSRPGGRNVNEQSVARLGGIAIALAFFVPLLTIFPAASTVAGSLRAESQRLIGLVLGGVLLGAVGVADDTRGVRALYKLAFQVLAACIAFWFGFRIEAIQIPSIATVSMGFFALPVTVIWIVGVVNAINLIDGLDGLAAGIAFFAALTNFVVAFVTDDVFVAAIMASMMGSILGFLFFNFNPARIFMGDSGSYFLGYVLGTTATVGVSQKTSTTVSILVPMLALGVPLFDTLFSVVRRFLERRPIFSADRGHIHHRLLDMGLTHRRSVLILYGVSLVFTIAAVGVSLGRSWQVGAALCMASAVLIALVRFAGYFEYVRSLKGRRLFPRSTDTELLRHSVPTVLIALAESSDESDVFGALAGFAESGIVLEVELFVRDTNQLLQRWEASDGSNRSDVVCTEIALGNAPRAEHGIRFRWRSHGGHVRAESTLLLQLVVDATAKALLKHSSPFLVPARVDSDAPLADRSTPAMPIAT